MVQRQRSREELVAGLIRVGELELTGEREAEVDAYFAPDFAFHGPDGAEGDYVACQTTIARTFVREFTHSPVGPLPPNGRRIVFELMNIFRYDDEGRLAEEWVQTDNRGRLRELGAEGG